MMKLTVLITDTIVVEVMSGVDVMAEVQGASDPVKSGLWLPEYLFLKMIHTLVILHKRLLYFIIKIML